MCEIFIIVVLNMNKYSKSEKDYFKYKNFQQLNYNFSRLLIQTLYEFEIISLKLT